MEICLTNLFEQTRFWYLNGESAQDNGAEDGISENAFKHVSLPVDLAGVDLVEELHHDEGVEDNGVVLRRGRMQRRVPATVDVKDLLTWTQHKTLVHILYECRCVHAMSE